MNMWTASSPCATGKSASERWRIGRRGGWRSAGVLVLVCWLLGVAPLVRGHQPYCEFADLTADAPWHVPDPSISYAYFGNVYPAGDIDYFRFEAAAGQSILISLSIPAIDDIAIYAPSLLLMGPGIPAAKSLNLPAELDMAEGHGAVLVPIGDKPSYFYEPFGGRYYWNYADTYFGAPETALYTVALWHPRDEIGRYAFVIGAREVFGGQAECFATYAEYWSPLIAGENPYRDTSLAAHSQTLEAPAEGAPQLSIALFPLASGGYYLRLSTDNFTFAPDNVGQPAIPNEGHAHLYIDGEKIGPLYGEWHRLDTLPTGAETLTVKLNSNDHRVFTVGGVEIADSLSLAALREDAA